MRAVDIMVRDVVTVASDTPISEAVKLLSEHDISALPVLENGRLIGIISEADLLHRSEIGTEKHRPWWIEAMTPATTLASDFTKSHGMKVGELMKTNVVTATEEDTVADIANLLERHRIKRVPIMAGGELVGIVSRANLIQALASSHGPADAQSNDDRRIRLDLLSRLSEQKWTDYGSRNIIVSDGTVHLWGLVGSNAEHQALIVLAESIPGVTKVSDEMIAI